MDRSALNLPDRLIRPANLDGPLGPVEPVTLGLGVQRLSRSMRQGECGLACLAMVLAHLGRRVSLDDLALRQNVSPEGLTLEELGVIANEYGMSTHAYRATIDQLQRFSHPAIIYWLPSHFVFFMPTGEPRFSIYDPASTAEDGICRERRFPRSVIEQLFGGVIFHVVDSNQTASARAT